VLNYARIDWVRSAKKVVYWGDIDAAGLQFVSDLRGYGVNVTTILMGLETLERFRHLIVEGAMPQRADLPHLNATERDVYRHLLDAATEGHALLLEQERIPWPDAYPALLAAVMAPL
jgi:hypothetical protein